MRKYLLLIAFICYLRPSAAEEIRLLDLEPVDAQNLIEQQDQTLKYAPKIETNVPEVRYLGEVPHNVLEDKYLAKQYHGQDGLGGYLYGYQVPDIAKNEEKKPSGDLKGAYNYINGAGQEIKVTYWDNGNGFHQEDNIPQILPQQIEDSPEVKAVKDAFFKRWQEEAERNTHPVQDPYNSEGQYASGPLSVEGQQERAKFFAQQPQQQQQQQQPQYKGAASAQPNFYAQQQSGSHQVQQQPQQQPQHQQQQPQHQGAASAQPSNVYVPQPSGSHQVQQQQQPQPQYQGAASAQPNVYAQQQQQQQPQHQGAASVRQSSYAQQPGGTQVQQQQDNEGEYSPDNEGKYIPEEGEESGPPKGFFYAFDYPVGIITQVQGRALSAEKSGDLKNVYEQNKQRYERQLQQGGTGGGSQYLIN